MKIIIDKILTVLLLAITMAACETDIEFKGKETTPLMVMNSILTPDSAIKIHLSKSKFFLYSNNLPENINNATVKVFVNNSLREKLTSKGEGFYTGLYFPKPNDKVKITASNDTFSEISSNVTIQNTASIVSVDTISKNIETKVNKYPDGTVIDSKRDFSIKIKFKDKSKNKDYYRLVLKEKQYFDDGSVLIRNTDFKSEDLVFGGVSENDIFGDGKSKSIFNEFNDDIFNDKTYELTLSKSYRKSQYLENNDNEKKNDHNVVEKKNEEVIKSELIIELHSISESMYYYLKTVAFGNDGLDFFSEPVQVYSNIDGGIGFLGSYSKTTTVFTIPLSYSDYNIYYDDLDFSTEKSLIE